MYTSFSLPKRLVLVQILAIQLLLICNVSAMNLTNSYLIHKCHVGEKVYQSRTKYEKNLNGLITSISLDNFNIGFRHSSREDPPNSATIIFGCRGDSYGPKCRACFATAVAGLRRRCNKDSVGTIWYDQCLLDVSGERRTQRKIDYEKPFSSHNPNNTSGDIMSFNKNIKDLLHKLMREAIHVEKENEIPTYYAVGEKMIGTKKLYAMVQCGKYVGSLCEDCLELSIRELSKCCDGKQGARVLSTVCNLRYELYPFAMAQKTV